MKVDVVNLKKHYGTTKAVDDVSFTFGSGEIFGFVGPNGAGKTTTMRILSTLDEPTDGDIYIDGVSVSQYPEKARHFVGFVPDNLPTHRDMTVHDYLDFFGRAYGLKGARRNKVVEEIEAFTNLLGIREKNLVALSKGMKQRVSVARALLHDPPVLVLDEPANGLDPRARIELRELLKALTAQGKAVLISSHILTELGEICDSVAIIEHGRMLRAGRIDQLASIDTPRRQVIVRVLDRHAEACQHLRMAPHVDAAAVTPDNILEVDVLGTDQACCEVLAGLVKAGFAVLEFQPRRAGLEEIFMNVTRGDVQ